MASLVSNASISPPICVIDIEPVFNAETLAGGDKSGLGDFPYRDELFLLWQYATVLEGQAAASRPAGQQNKDYNYRIDWEQEGVDGPGTSPSTNAHAAARSTCWSPS